MMVGLTVNVWQGLTAFKIILVVLILMNVLLVKIPFPQMIQKGHTKHTYVTDPKRTNVSDTIHANVYGPKTCKC